LIGNAQDGFPWTQFLAGKKPAFWFLLYYLQSAFIIGMLVQTLHRLQRAAIRDVFGLRGGE
jgi:hypothetical protein